MDPIVVETWEQLATVPLATAVSLVVVQFVKLFANLGAVWWQRLSALTSVVVMVGATVAGTLGVATSPGDLALALTLAVINGMIAGVAASRTFDAVRETVAKI